MDVNCLDDDFFKVECEVRKIKLESNEITDQVVNELASQISEEVQSELRPRYEAHQAAKQNPKTEVLKCFQYFQKIFIEFKNELESGKTDENLIIQYFTKMHFCLERLERMTYSRILSNYLPQMLSVSRKIVESTRKFLTKAIVLEDLLVCLQKVKMPKELVRRLEEVPDQTPEMDQSELSIAKTTDVDNSQVDIPAEMAGMDLNRGKDLPPIVIRNNTMVGMIPFPKTRSEEFIPTDQRASDGYKSNGASRLKQVQLQGWEKGVLQDPSKWNIRYDGSRSPIPIERFFHRIERLAEKAQIPTSKLLDLMNILLGNEALEWYWLYIERHPNVSWFEFKEEMAQRFKSNRTDDDIVAMINQRKQMYPKESFQEYYDAILKMVVLAHDPMTDREIYHVLRRNMRPGLQMEVCRNGAAQSLAHFVRQCVELEDRWKRFGFNPEIGMNRFNFQPTSYSRGPPKVNELWETDVEQEIWPQEKTSRWYESAHDENSTYYLNAFQARNSNHHPIDNYRNVPKESTSKVDFSVAPKVNKSFETPMTKTGKQFECWNCKAPDHSFIDCRQEFNRIFCFGCGNDNVRRPDCSKCNPNQGNRQSDTLYARRQWLAKTDQKPRPTTTTEEAASNTDPELYWRQKQH